MRRSRSKTASSRDPPLTIDVTVFLDLESGAKQAMHCESSRMFLFLTGASCLQSSPQLGGPCASCKVLDAHFGCVALCCLWAQSSRCRDSSNMICQLTGTISAHQISCSIPPISVITAFCSRRAERKLQHMPHAKLRSPKASEDGAITERSRGGPAVATHHGSRCSDRSGLSHSEQCLHTLQ